MINQIRFLESCWHLSPPWGQTMPPLAVQILEEVFLSSSDLPGYCCGVHWEGQEWVYAIFCLGEILYLPSKEFHPTNVFKNGVVPSSLFKLGDIVEVDFTPQPTRRIIQGIFRLKSSWLYGVEWCTPIVEETALSQSQFIWLADVDLVKV
ncbi:DUF1392 domain-containing protein [Nostoc sp. LEGE 12450]|uniref:DUF1392 domain-containing protein n=1 Tax=Nostoc sp. LEGE 12450 TaxID=1828643 RepID=UPI00188154FE|nr:DUF1392 domain-containing protein [Nostoc sp. LEGE 12450]MBE8989786.1 DUF1392 domain-containing protein [Nostoc sp. LEGE 12450]